MKQTTIRDEVRAVCEVVPCMKPLNLINAIEITITELCRIQTAAKANCFHITRVADQLKTSTIGKEIDPDDVLTDLIEKAQDSLERLTSDLNAGRTAAIDAVELHGEDKDNVVSEYQQTISAVSDLYSAFENVRWAVMNHDAKLSRVSKSYTSVDDLIQDLNIKK